MQRGKEYLIFLLQNRQKKAVAAAGRPRGRLSHAPSRAPSRAEPGNKAPLPKSMSIFPPVDAPFPFRTPSPSIAERRAMSLVLFLRCHLALHSAAALRPPSPHTVIFSCWKIPSDPPTSCLTRRAAERPGPDNNLLNLAQYPQQERAEPAARTPHTHTRGHTGHTLQVPSGSYSHH